MRRHKKRVIRTHAVEETIRLGERLGQSLVPGSVVALVGTLGSGKTSFVKGVARGNEAPPDVTVTSPTFVIVNEYPGRLCLYHLDAYRLRTAADLDKLGFDEMVTGHAAVVIEWADRVGERIPADHLWIEIRISGETERRFVVSAGGPVSGHLLASLVP